MQNTFREFNFGSKGIYNSVRRINLSYSMTRELLKYIELNFPCFVDNEI